MYDKDGFQTDKSSNEIGNALNEGKMMWVDLENPSEDDLKILSDVFKFHHLAIEDCVHKLQRPKVDNYKNYYFIVLNEFKEGKVSKYFTYSQLYVFLGEKYIVTVHWEELQVLKEALERVYNAPEMFERGIDFILYNLLDAIVDDYFPLTDDIGDKIDRIEEIILRNPKKQIQDEILVIKRNIIKLRKVLSPQREVVNILLRHDFPLIREANRMYYMDVYDHMLRIYDMLDTFADLLAGTLDLYMSQISNRMNEVMKVLTMITTIMMPLSLIAGIYGMNFKFMPELESRHGYFATLVAMGLIALAEVIYFRKKKWL
jgi:magnesium transporter